MEGSNRALAGMEVPITGGGDSIKWVEVFVPNPDSALPSIPCAPPTEDAASCAVIGGDPPTYLIWKIHKGQQNALEVLELCGHKEFPRVGLRIMFPDALCPFAYICKDEIKCASGNLYLLYALTVSGVAYLIKLKNICNYTSGSIFRPNEILQFSIQTYPCNGDVTAVAATTGCIVIGRKDGSVGCFRLGIFEPSSPDFAYELRDDAGFSRLWGLMSRNRNLAAVKDLVVYEEHGKRLLFVLYSDGVLRVWDLSTHSKVFSDNMSIPMLTGMTVSRLWVGEANNDTCLIPFAIRYKNTVAGSMETIYIFNLRFSVGDKVTFSLEPVTQNIPLEEGGLVDVKLTSDKIWVLKEDELLMQDVLGANDRGGPQRYGLQEAFVADQLFQSYEHSSDDLLWLTLSVFSSVKDHIVPFLSSIFLRRLLVPGVHDSSVLRATLQDYNKYFTDSEFCSLTFDGLKGEILSVIEHQGVSESPLSMLHFWKTFCARYFQFWCKNSAPLGLIIDSSSGVTGLVRKNSISLFRCLEDIELLIDGSLNEIGDIMSSGLNIYDDNPEREILFDVLHCISNVSQQLGKAASTIFYESLLGAPTISSEEVVPRLLKILETGYSSTAAAFHVADLGTDVAWEKEVADHKNLRKFSVDMFLSLRVLCNKATSWEKVLNVIENYLKFLVPRKTIQKLESVVDFSTNTSIIVQATSQVAKQMFESVLDILLLLNYMVNISGQINMLHTDISRVQLELVPMIQELVTEWHIIHYFGTTPSESPVVEDFSSQLSSLQIDGNVDKKSWNDKLGKCDFTLAFVLLLNADCSFDVKRHHSSKCLPNPSSCIGLVREFTSWIIWGTRGEESSDFFSHSTELALILLRHGQYDAVEFLLTIVDAHSRKEKIFESMQSVDGHCSVPLHLLGCCLLAQAHRTVNRVMKERKIGEAVRCFFRASSLRGAPEALRSLPYERGFPNLGFSGSTSAASWRLNYYQWAMQIFEQHSMSEAACQFAVAALEQVDEAIDLEAESSETDPLNESTTTVRGRLWANVFKFTLDLDYFYDAYCAIISNPDEESKYICLRRFIIVLYERDAIKIICDGQLPFIGLTEKVEQELAWKAERSDLSVKPNPFKLLYAFAMHQHNWRMAASYIYKYSALLRADAALKDHQHRSVILQERLNGLSAAINALHLVHPAYAWIDPIFEEQSLQKEHYPSKKARLTWQEQAGDDAQHQKLQSCLSIEKLENEFVLTSAEYLLSLANVKWTFTEIGKPSQELVDLLVHTSLYDLAFTVLLKFWKGSGLKRELERIFVAMSLKCCPNRVGSMLVGNDFRTQALALTSSKDREVVHGSFDFCLSGQLSNGNSQWGTLEIYLEKYCPFHPRLPVIIAETLLCADPHIELPRWLIQKFKCIQGYTWGMAGDESNPASLFRLYVDYGRYAEATNLLLEYIESLASVRPSDISRRKSPSAVWFPYLTIERLWCQLEELISSGRMIDQCEKLKTLLQGALMSHLNLLKVDSSDAESSLYVKVRDAEASAIS